MPRPRNHFNRKMELTSAEHVPRLGEAEPEPLSEETIRRMYEVVADHTEDLDVQTWLVTLATRVGLSPSDLKDRLERRDKRRKLRIV